MFDDEPSAGTLKGVSEQGVAACGVVLGVRDRLSELVRGLEAGMVAVGAAPGLWDAFDAVEKLAVAGKLLIGQRVDASGVARQRGFRDTAEYLAQRSGCSKREASRQLRASRQLADLPATQTAVRQGEISDDQAVAVADAATADPEAERGLLTMANRASLRELQDACLRVKAKADPNPERTRKRQHRDRFLRHGRRPDGTFSLYGQGPPEDQGLLQAALRHGIEDRFRTKTRTDDGDDDLDSYDQRAYDALFDILRTYIHEGPFADLPDHHAADSGDAPTDSQRTSPEGAAWDSPSGRAGNSSSVNDIIDRRLVGVPAKRGQLPLAVGELPAPDLTRGPAPGAASGDALPDDVWDQPSQAASSDRNSTMGTGRRNRRKRRKPNAAYTTLIRIDLEALNRGREEGDEVCDMPGLGPISVPAVRALLPESIIRLILTRGEQVATRGEQVATVVYAGRGPNMAQKMALSWMQPVCTVESCNSQIVQADHRIDWATTHHTTLAELDHLCPHHHNLKTHKDWALVQGTGKRALVPPDDPRHPNHQPAPQASRPSWSDAA